MLLSIFSYSPWKRCRVLPPEERLALWEIRVGYHKAKKRLQEKRVLDKIDIRYANKVNRNA